jgi:phage putative head morphogenesis protein, SPP1 gp7 family
MPELTANEKLLDLAFEESFRRDRLTATQARKVDKLLRNLKLDLQRQLSAFPEGTRDTHSTARAREQLAAINRLIDKGIDKLDLEKDLIALGNDQAKQAASALKSATPFSYDFVTPAKATVRTLVTRRMFRGRLLNDWVTSLKRGTKTRVYEQMNIGLALGEDIPKLAKRISFAVDTTRHHAKTIVRTAATQVAADSTEETLKENSDIIKGYMYVATLDDRVTERCLSLDGNVYELGKGPRPPQHHNCRSVIVPVLKSWEELGFNLKKNVAEMASTRASLDGAIPEKTNGWDWLKKQPANRQDKILGATKGLQLRKGLLKKPSDAVIPL